MKILVTILLAAMLFVSAFVCAGDLEPAAAPAPTMKTLDEVEPRIPITQNDIPLTISSPGSYYFTANLTAASTAILVQSDDVTIDLMGYSLSGTTGSGVYISDASGIEIKNGTIRGFATAGIYVYSMGTTHGNMIYKLKVMGNGYGATMSGNANIADSCIFADNTSNGLSLGTGGMIKNCTAYNNGSTGLAAGSNSSLIGNVSYSNGGSGVSGDYACTIKENTVYGNTSAGIFANVGSMVLDNTIRYNNLGEADNLGGIRLSHHCVARGNTIYYNRVSGIYCYNYDNVIENNFLSGSTYGIYFRAAGSCYVNNRFADISTLNVYNSASQTDGGGNISF